MLVSWVGYKSLNYESHGIIVVVSLTVTQLFQYLEKKEDFTMGKALKREKLEEIKEFNSQIQEESMYWKQKAKDLEKELTTRQDSFTTMREELDKNKLQLLQLGEWKILEPQLGFKFSFVACSLMPKPQHA